MARKGWFQISAAALAKWGRLFYLYVILLSTPSLPFLKDPAEDSDRCREVERQIH